MQRRIANIAVTVACVLTVVALAACAPETGRTAEPTKSSAPTVQVAAEPESPDADSVYAQGGAAYDAATAAFEFPLPQGYSWTAGADRAVTTDAAEQYVWYDWIAANVDAALDGDSEAAQLLASTRDTIPFEGAFRDDIRGLIDTSNYSVLLTMFPLPDGMRSF